MMRNIRNAAAAVVLGLLLSCCYTSASAESRLAGSFHDPDLYLFVNDDHVLLSAGLARVLQPLRRESSEPVFLPDPVEDGTAIGYSTVAFDRQMNELKLWYLNYTDWRLRLAASKDHGKTWIRRGQAITLPGNWGIDNASVVAVGPGVDPWFAGARFVGIAYFNRPPEGFPSGNYAMRSMDGERFEIQLPPVLPEKGDRSSITYDEVAGRYFFFTRPFSQAIPGMPWGFDIRLRLVRMWTGEDLVHWMDRGVVLKHDDDDPEDVQIYGAQVFRYGKGFLAFLEILHQAIERMDTQLAWSADGLKWERVGGRGPMLPMGGEGAWDSHFVVPTLNAPIPNGDRLLVPYLGGSTKHGSGKSHKKAIGLASIRRDGWVSLEAGRGTEGVLLTNPVPLTEPMRLDLNVNAFSGYVAVDVLTPEGAPVEGYTGESSRVEKVDAVRHRVAWGDRRKVQPIRSGACLLRFKMKQGSLFSFRWSKAGSD